MVTNSAILFGFALVSHVIAGGSFTAISQLFAMGFLIFCILLILGRSVLSGPRLALIVLIVQSATHFVLGEMSGGSFAMSASHILGGLISFVLLTRSDEFWFALRNLVLIILRPFTFVIAQFKVREFLVRYRDLECWCSALLTSSHGLRAPPALSKNGIFA
jgi:hypothetical protein